MAHMILATVAAAVLERKWSRAIPGESPPQRLARLADHRAHQSRQKERRVARLDSLLDRAEASAGYPTTVPLCGAARIEWDALPPGCDPCLVSSKMREGTLRGDRKRESVSAMAWLLREALLPLAPARPTIVDAGCGTGSLLLPLAALITDATFVGVDTKRGSLDRMMARAAAAGPELEGRVVPWHGRIEDYEGELQCVVSLHACGGASDAALQLATRRRVPFAVSPCCIGKLRRGPASRWLRELIALAEPEAAAAEATFALLAAWADSEHVAAAAPAPSVARRGATSDLLPLTSEQPAAEAAVAARLVATAHGVASARRQRAKTLVELDRLAALGEGEWRHEPAGPAPPAGRLLRIEGPAMRTSGQAEVITGPCRLDECVPL